MVMHVGNKPQDPGRADLGALPPAEAAAVRALWRGAVGRTVRCVPTRRTVMHADGGRVWFAKWRVGGRRTAAAEWQWLHLLPMLGLSTPEPVAWLGRGRRSLLVMRGVPGRSLATWILLAHREGWLAELVAYLCREVAPRLRRLHGAGLVYRDLYWQHVVAEAPRRGSPPVFLDVERVLQPRWRWRRWVVKDFAGLLASWPAEVPLPVRAMWRFVRIAVGSGLRVRRSWWRAVAAKATQVRGRQPRFG
ncbi:MAG: hypothetical protein JNK49_00360 [Planctomycetes bacterium]|nr:hypothetical protein [Planctomycetota bacterium]